MSPRLPVAGHPSPLVLLALCAALAACDGGGEDPDLQADADADGLDNAFEAQVGTDPDRADTDGDGCDDAVEVLTWFDPLVAADRPYQGMYPRGPRPDDAGFAALAEAYGEGFDEGQLNSNWTLLDQHGEEVELYDFFGQVVVVVIGREWCVPCQEDAVELEEFYQEQKDRGFVALQLLLEGVEDDSVPQPDRWAEALGLSYPALGDHSPGDYTQTTVAQHYIDTPGLYYSTPNHTILDRELRTVALYLEARVDTGDLLELLEAPVPAVERPQPANADALRAELGLSADTWLVSPEVCGG